MSNKYSHCSQGRVSTLPGAVSGTDEQCDDHPERKAVKRVQGETDSMGCEYIHLCKECLDKIALPIRISGHCDRCKSQVEDLRHHRDFEEGASGPVYRVCGSCVKKENEAVANEIAANAGYDDDPIATFYDTSYYVDWIQFNSRRK